jgi:AraC family transcriptional regulator of adaptative response/methylated-DNA-[protein]-cysteine methyltransferase
MIWPGRASTLSAMNANICFDIGSSSLGHLLVAVNEKGICAILPGDSPRAVLRELRERFPSARIEKDSARLAPVLPPVIDFFDGRSARLELPLDPAGTEFQQRVWRALRAIPAGATASYAEIARRVNAPKSFRAVAQACGANPLALAIPCHRVVRSDGGLSGYRWGAARKRALLEREAAR